MNSNRYDVSVSDEYIDSLCEWLIDFGKAETSYTVTQFLKERRVGYYYLKSFCQRYPRLENAFEVMKYMLHDRWIRRCFSNQEMPVHQQKVMMKYINAYDTHVMDINAQIREKLYEAQGRGQASYYSENYGERSVSKPYPDPERDTSKEA